MKEQDVKDAVFEAERFLKRAKALLSKVNGDKFAMYHNPKESGAVRRASLDLTRSLAEMRKSR